jgi:hypothetical protein
MVLTLSGAIRQHICKRSTIESSNTKMTAIHEMMFDDIDGCRVSSSLEVGRGRYLRDRIREYEPRRSIWLGLRQSQFGSDGASQLQVGGCGRQHERMG